MARPVCISTLLAPRRSGRALGMKPLSPKRLLALGALLLLALAMGSRIRGRAVSPPPAVGLLSVENNPLAHPPRVPGVFNGVTGLSAFFVVTNVGKDAGIWFDTCALEQKVGAEWQRTPVPPYTVRVVQRLLAGQKPWHLIASDFFPGTDPMLRPGTVCSFAVEWPPSVPTNATWRLQLRYGRAPSAFTRKMSDTFDFTGKLGSMLFNTRRADGMLLTPEVRQ